VLIVSLVMNLLSLGLNIARLAVGGRSCTLFIGCTTDIASRDTIEPEVSEAQNFGVSVSNCKTKSAVVGNTFYLSLAVDESKCT
jgi:hypothetical protein